jgi:hypothetical protein
MSSICRRCRCGRASTDCRRQVLRIRARADGRHACVRALSGSPDAGLKRRAGHGSIGRARCEARQDSGPIAPIRRPRSPTHASIEKTAPEWPKSRTVANASQRPVLILHKMQTCSCLQGQQGALDSFVFVAFSMENRCPLFRKCSRPTRAQNERDPGLRRGPSPMPRFPQLRRDFLIRGARARTVDAACRFFLSRRER